MKLGEAVGWIEAHPVEAAVIGGAGVLGLLWIFGAFGGGSSSASAGASNLAGAYYAAEAQQAVVGGQVQQATIAANQATAVAGLNASAAQAIADTQARAAVAINGQNAGLGKAISHDQLFATYSNNDALKSDTASNNAAAAQIAATHDQAGLMQTLLGQVIPIEMAQAQAYGGADVLNIPGIGSISTGPGSAWDLNALAARGYSADQIKQLTGL